MTEKTRTIEVLVFVFKVHIRKQIRDTKWQYTRGKNREEILHSSSFAINKKINSEHQQYTNKKTSKTVVHQNNLIILHKFFESKRK